MHKQVNMSWPCLELVPSKRGLQVRLEECNDELPMSLNYNYASWN